MNGVDRLLELGASVMTLGVLGIILATINVVGGYAVTDRMLEMFKKRKKAK